MDDDAMEIDPISRRVYSFNTVGKPFICDHVGWQQSQPQVVKALMEEEAVAGRRARQSIQDSELELYDPCPGFKPPTRPRLRATRSSARRDRRKIPPSLNGGSPPGSPKNVSTPVLDQATEELNDLAANASTEALSRAERRSAASKRQTDGHPQKTHHSGKSTGKRRTTVLPAQNGTVARGSRLDGNTRPAQSASRTRDDSADAMDIDSDSFLYANKCGNSSSQVATTSTKPVNSRRTQDAGQSQATPPGLAIVASTPLPAEPSTSHRRHSPITPPADDPPPTHRKSSAAPPTVTPSFVARPGPPRPAQPSNQSMQRFAAPLGMTSMRRGVSSQYQPSPTLPTRQRGFKTPSVQSKHPPIQRSVTKAPMVMTARASLPRDAAPITPDDTPPRPKDSAEDEDMDEARDADSSFTEFESFDADALEEAMKPYDQL
ncbi:uncharacterized protein B0H18DRAFT_358464 [Fomitopsis serialis]|uniref:uncharacterized protein n=1 Tax=Fomitopsis serialis TaxID=139415 RepID=UPI0020073175|nr:uncharacterized protein B0H18DRAFT_136482 [Neoantrodia serialis]XP_047893339.1 uncharacterized protein B0H18DRAFT_358464 [Neoantrodia serialis]KAH9914423.1 hypothetical protein B0H18DRAFT_136482 [Neoantrodia serialis]KAH9925964.1 hypothetical protein B0H18DRAFT_358464 [Neoantrodia serialis]